MQKENILIVGQGIAGSVLAFQFPEDRFHVTILDDGHLSSSSMVAAGMWNPLSFKKPSIGWNSEQLLDSARSAYGRISEKLKIDFFYFLPLNRVFPDQRSANDWDDKSTERTFGQFVINNYGKKLHALVKQPFGHGTVNHAGWCDLPKLLNTSRDFFSKKNQLIEGTFDSNELHSDEDVWSYDGIKYNRIILAIGSKNSTLSYFDWVPLYPNKGQVLTVRPKEYYSEEILNYGNFVLPIGDGKYRVGGTYEFNDPNPSITEESKQKLLNKLQTVVSDDFEIVDQKAGYRPTIPDRRPTVGEHPNIKNLYLFNGFGSKGVMYAPDAARQLVDSIMHGTPIDTDISVRRYFKA